MTVLITGAAGFIGFHVSQKLLADGHTVIGLDNLNDYYDVKLKEDRLAILMQHDIFQFNKISLENRAGVNKVFERSAPVCVINLAAQAGVRYSLHNPYAYVDANVVGFLNVLEACRHNQVGHFIFASSSSVYGANTKLPFSVHDNVDHPVSLYAATKKANELMAHTYSHLYGLPATGLRFFTVYGPWGRPDMALYLFTKAILEGKPLQVFNHGEMMRDFTYVDDIVDGVVRLVNKPPQPNPKWSGDKPDPATSYAPYRLYNIGNNQPVELMKFIETIEQTLGKVAIKEFLPLQAGDVPQTYANVDDLVRDLDFKPTTTIEEGIGKFVAWYKEYYGVK